MNQSLAFLTNWNLVKGECLSYSECFFFLILHLANKAMNYGKETFRFHHSPLIWFILDFYRASPSCEKQGPPWKGRQSVAEQHSFYSIEINHNPLFKKLTYFSKYYACDYLTCAARSGSVSVAICWHSRAKVTRFLFLTDQRKHQKILHWMALACNFQSEVNKRKSASKGTCGCVLSASL